MGNEFDANKNGYHTSFFQQLKKFFQTTWQKTKDAMPKEKFDEHGGYRAACQSCGAPVVRFRNFAGADYNIAVADAALMSYFRDRKDIDEFVYDRLHRAEGIITQLRKENAELREKLG